jgi:hypothetical protein
MLKSKTIPALDLLARLKVMGTVTDDRVKVIEGIVVAFNVFKLPVGSTFAFGTY